MRHARSPPALRSCGFTPARELLLHCASRFECLRETPCDAGQIDRAAAGEYVDGRVPSLRPGVDRNMAFGDDDHAADPPGRKLVEHRLHYSRPRCASRLDERSAHEIHAIEAVACAVVKVENDLMADGDGAK